MSRLIPRFLSTNEVVQLHRVVIEKYGGALGIRDPGLLDAAVHAPQASFGGEYLYPDVFDMAAVYLLHIAANHAFVDGNKRTAWYAARVFLNLNGYRVKPRWKDVVEQVEAIGAGSIRNWRDIAEWLAAHAEQFS